MTDELARKNAQIRVKISFNEVEDARALLAEILPKGNSETYYLASLVAQNDEERFKYLENAIGYDDTNEEAQKALSELIERNPEFYDPRKTRKLILTCWTLSILWIVAIFGLAFFAFLGGINPS